MDDKIKQTMVLFERGSLKIVYDRTVKTMMPIA